MSRPSRPPTCLSSHNCQVPVLVQGGQSIPRILEKETLFLVDVKQVGLRGLHDLDSYPFTSFETEIAKENDCLQLEIFT